jgi:hypothetical protein
LSLGDGRILLLKWVWLAVVASGLSSPFVADNEQKPMDQAFEDKGIKIASN